MKEVIKDTLKVMLILIIFAGILTGLIFVIGSEADKSKDLYNNGICTECGGRYRFSSATHLKNGGDYFYYSCEDCDHTIRTNIIMK